MPQIKDVITEKGKVTYLNSGDWIENLTALEYNKGAWEIFNYDKNYFDLIYPTENFTEEDIVTKILSASITEEIFISHKTIITSSK